MNAVSECECEATMSISEISNQGSPVPISSGKKSKEPVKAKAQSSDKVNLSSEARSLFEAGQTTRMKEIKERIDSKFYFQPEVTEKVVDAILKELGK